MKKCFALIIFLAFSSLIYAQTEKLGNGETSGGKSSPLCVDFCLMGGLSIQNYTNGNLGDYYAAKLNSNIDNVSNLKVTNGASIGGNLQVGYFFGKKKHLGLGIGILYLNQNYNIGIDSFHVEYRSLDNRNDTFRQLLTTTGFKESIQTTNINIPIILKYQTKLSDKIDFSIDAGIVYNLTISNQYKTDAVFDYEAIYKFDLTKNPAQCIYDYSPIAGIYDLYYTKQNYLATHTGGNAADYLNLQQSHGFNVGLRVAPNSKSGIISYKTGSIGFLIQPALNFKVNRNLSVLLGCHIIQQTFANSALSNYMITDKVGSYNSLLQDITKTSSLTMGLNLGVRYFLPIFEKTESE